MSSLEAELIKEPVPSELTLMIIVVGYFVFAARQAINGVAS
jgi:hypothetical protein